VNFDNVGMGTLIVGGAFILLSILLFPVAYLTGEVVFVFVPILAALFFTVASLMLLGVASVFDR